MSEAKDLVNRYFDWFVLFREALKRLGVVVGYISELSRQKKANFLLLMITKSLLEYHF